jgi:hypothetical protein
VNYLVLSWRINKTTSLPLFFVELDKAGNSRTADRIDLLEAFNTVFGFHRIKSLTADREFVGETWFEMLNKNKIPYFIRVKENILLPWGKTPTQAKKLFHPLKTGHSKRLETTLYGATVYVAGTLSATEERVIIMTNQNLQAMHILTKYRERWSIEELFRKLKTSGFHWENTHMKQSARLVTLLVILGFALLIAYLMGQGEKIPWKRTLGCFLYSVFKKGLIKCQFLLAKSLAQAVKTILNLLVRAPLAIR